MSDNEIPVKVDVSLSAKAEFKAEVPTSSVGRLVDAVTDIFRPFSEARGLKADQIRLQREDVLLEIAKRAKIRLEIEGSSPQPIPNKILVPLLEQASLEDIKDSEMLDRWANLLAHESSTLETDTKWMIDILSSLNGKLARSLEDIFNVSKEKDVYSIENITFVQAQKYFDSTLERLSYLNAEKLENEFREIYGLSYVFPGEDIPNTNEFILKDIIDIKALNYLSNLDLIWINSGSFVNMMNQQRYFVVNAQLTQSGFDFVEAVSRPVE